MGGKKHNTAPTHTETHYHLVVELHPYFDHNFLFFFYNQKLRTWLRIIHCSIPLRCYHTLGHYPGHSDLSITAW